MTEEILQTLNIHKLTQEQYNTFLESGTIEENSLYLTPYEQPNLTSYATKEDLSSALQSVFDLIYPVGSIYMSIVSTDPSTLFGGTWERIKDTFLLASGNIYTAGSVGGEAEHTLTIDEMPEHNHEFVRPQWFISESGEMEGESSILGTQSVITDAYFDSKNIQSTGGSQPHNNLPPYLAVYTWKRIS